MTESKTVSSPRVAVIILNWNNKQLLSKCLSSFELVHYPSLYLVVVDNASSDGSAEMVSRDFPNAKLLVNKSNLGWTSGNNVGIEYALSFLDPKYILLLNNDTVMLQQDFVLALVEASQRLGQPGIVGCRVLAEDRSLQQSGWYFAKNFREILVSKGMVHEIDDAGEETRVDGVSGACFLIDRSVIERIGPLDDDFTPFGFDELEYFSRARNVGIEVLYTPRAYLLHYGGSSISKVSSARVARYIATNMMRFAFVQLPLGTFLLFNVLTAESALFRERKFSRSVFFPAYVLANLTLLKEMRKFMAKRAQRKKERLSIHRS